LDDSRIRVLADGEHHGLPRRLNEAIQLSNGKYFARMDGDDVAYPERIDRQVRYLEEHSEIDLLGTGILVFKANGHALGTRVIRESHDEICSRPWAGFYLPHPSWMGRSGWFRQHLYRPEATRMEDQDLLLRSYRTSRFASLSEILMGYREDSFSLQKALRARFHFVKLFGHSFFQKKAHRSFALRGIAEHTMKAMAEVFAVATGQVYRVLRHRALPVSPREVARWEQVWRDLEESENGNSIRDSDAPVSLTT
jgi:glycosyltransferase involved in cell wall biosynthesis